MTCKDAWLDDNNEMMTVYGVVMPDIITLDNLQEFHLPCKW